VKGGEALFAARLRVSGRIKDRDDECVRAWFECSRNVETKRVVAAFVGADWIGEYDERGKRTELIAG